MTEHNSSKPIDGRKQPLPVWTLPFLLTLVGIVALVGNLQPAVLATIGAEVLVVCGYVIVLGRRESSTRQPTSNLLALLPGNLLVLLIIALLDRPNVLAWLWTFVPLTTIAYDMVGRSQRLASRVRMSISMILYVILWADLFFVLERAVVLHRQLVGVQEIMIAAAFGLVGTLFLSLGIYRHRFAAKE